VPSISVAPVIARGRDAESFIDSGIIAE
jgi:hypothetical protein